MGRPIKLVQFVIKEGSRRINFIKTTTLLRILGFWTEKKSVSRERAVVGIVGTLFWGTIYIYCLSTWMAPQLKASDQQFHSKEAKH